MDTERVIVAAGVVVVLTLLFAVVVPFGRALVQRVQSGPARSGEAAELDEIRERLRSLEGRELRVAELEERLDFAERLLTREREGPPLGPGGPGR